MTLCQDWGVDSYLQTGVPASKLLLGIPTYGRSFTLVSPSQNQPGQPHAGVGVAGTSTEEPGMLAYYEVGNLNKVV